MKKKIYTFLFFIAIIAALFGYFATEYTLSRGMRAGKLVKLSQTGFVLKTYEGVLDLGSGNDLTWNFSIHDNTLGEALSKEIGKTVRLEYRVLFAKLFYATRYDITSWSLEGQSNDMNYLCRLVDFLRENKSVVDFLRGVIKDRDPELLRVMRGCQK